MAQSSHVVSLRCTFYQRFARNERTIIFSKTFPRRCAPPWSVPPLPLSPLTVEFRRVANRRRDSRVGRSSRAVPVPPDRDVPVMRPKLLAPTTSGRVVAYSTGRNGPCSDWPKPVPLRYRSVSVAWYVPIAVSRKKLSQSATRLEGLEFFFVFFLIPLFSGCSVVVMSS